MTLRRLASVPACAAASVAVQLSLMRAVGAPAGLSFLVALLLVVLAWQLPAAILLGGRREERPLALTFLAVPVLLAAAQATGRVTWGPPAVAVLAIGAVVGGVLLVRRPGAPLACAVAGSVLGFTFQAALSGGGRAASSGRLVGLLALGMAAAFALAVAVLQPRGGLLRRAAHPAAALVYLAVSLTLLTRSKEPEKPGRAFAKGPPPVVLVVLDSVRADHLKSYGYTRDTMPSLERFAGRHLVRFERSIASAASSLPSHGSMFTGLLASRHGGHECDATIVDPRVSQKLTPIRPDVPTLAQQLRRAGYWTVGISANFGHLAPGLGAGRGFEWYDASPGWQRGAARVNPYRFGRGGSFLAPLGRWYPFSDSQLFERPAPVPDRRAAEIVDLSLSALRQAGGDSFFLFVNLFDPHQPYRAPLGWRERYGEEGGLPERTYYDSVVKGRASTPEELRRLVNAYDSELTYVDSQLARLLAALEAHPRFAEMLLIVVGDHGEAFGEHGVFTHGLGLHDELVRVPLFLKAGRDRSGFPAGGSTAAPFQSVDVTPSVLEHAGLPVPPGLDGIPFGRARAVSTSETFVCLPVADRQGGRFFRTLSMAEAAPWKLIVSSRGERELFRISTDPKETRNLAAEEPEVVSRLESVLGTMSRDRPAHDPAYQMSPDLIRSLRALGYLN